MAHPRAGSEPPVGLSLFRRRNGRCWNCDDSSNGREFHPLGFNDSCSTRQHKPWQPLKKPWQPLKKELKMSIRLTVQVSSTNFSRLSFCLGLSWEHL